MNIIEYYQHLSSENSAANLIVQLMSSNINVRNLAINSFSSFVSKKISDLEFKKYLPLKIQSLLKYDLLLDEAGIPITPDEALIIIEDFIYLEILLEEIKQKNGRRLQFLASFKNTSLEFFCFSIDILFCKLKGIEIADLLSFTGSLNKYEFNFLINQKEQDRIELFKMIIYRKRKCIFLDEEFVGFDNYSKINNIDEMLNLVYDEVEWLSGYFFKKEGIYFEKYKNLKVIHEFPTQKSKNKTQNQFSNENVIVKSDDLTNCLEILELSSMPKDLKELKKAFFKLAQKTHPDKFEHLSKGKQTEILILDKFRRVQSAYEYVESRLKNN